MPIDYDKIRHENIKEYGEGTRHLEFFNLLYPDRTHFVYELLQNAEDARATKVLFKLYQNKLEVMHDGRPFNENDVIGICGIDIGTKTEDLTKIGKFGIGFKSVYVYTASPEVHSGSEHFKIKNYVRPYQIKPKTISGNWTTLFVLHLNAKGLDIEKACRDISTRLASLSANTLLFLRNIKKIGYQLPNMERGFYQCEEKAGDFAKKVTVVGKSQANRNEDNWLVFEKPINSFDGASTVSIELAFRVKSDPVTKYPKIVKTNNSPLNVFFPTEKETHLGFLIQGPYRTTPSRDNIPKEDKWNTKLIKETAVFTVECLQMLKKMKLMTVNTLLMLPIRVDDFPSDSMFYPVFEEVKNALINFNLLPTNDNAFASAKQVKLARGAEMRNLLNPEQLKALFHASYDIRWLSDSITQDRTPELKKYLTRTLGIDELTPEGFAKRVTGAFFDKQTDEWMIKFYRYIRERKELWRSGREYGVTTGPLYNKAFIRLQNGSHVSPFNNAGAPNAFISDGSNLKTNHPVVKFNISKEEEVKLFLNELGIPDLDIVEEVIESLLPKYHESIPDIEHWQDIELIKRAWNTDSQQKKRRLKKALQKTTFILAEIPGTGNTKFIKPKEAYFRNADLKDYFDGYNKIGFVSHEYDQDMLEIFKDLGASETVRVYKKNINPKGFIIISNISGQHERGVDGFDPDTEVEGLANALKKPSRKRSEFIWNNIALKNVKCIFGTVEKSTRQTYTKAEENKCYSAFGHLLVDTNWLPIDDIGFVSPSELCLEDLPASYIKDEQLADKLGMQKNVHKQLADDVGISLEDIDFLKKYPEEFEKWKADIIYRKKNVPQKTKITESETMDEVDFPLDDFEQIKKVSKPDVISTASSPARKESIHEFERSDGESLENSTGDSTSVWINSKGTGHKNTDLTNTENAKQKEGLGPSSTSKARTNEPEGQKRLLSYVSCEDYDEEFKNIESNQRSFIIGEAAVDIVIEHEKKINRKVRCMSHNNPGYDIVSEAGGEEKYIEVKGLEGTWGERGVALSNKQFFYVKENINQNYWLYVVENVFSKSPVIHKLKNPIDQVNLFAFDGGWTQVADSFEEKNNKRGSPSRGDEVLINGNIVGIVESVSATGKFPLVNYRAADGKQHRKRLSEVNIRSKGEG